MASSLERAFRENRWTGIGAIAVIVGVVFAYASLRKQGSVPVVIDSGSGTSAGTGTSDLSAFTAGAAAAGSGFDTGAALGQGGLGLAGSVVSDFASLSSTLAASQAQVAATATSDLAGVFGSFMDWLQSSPGNPPPGSVVPPSVLPPPISPVWLVVVGPSAVVEYSSLNAAGQLMPWLRYQWGPKASQAPCLAPVTKAIAAGGSAAVALVTAGQFANKWVHVAGGVTVVHG